MLNPRQGGIPGSPNTNFGTITNPAETNGITGVVGDTTRTALSIPTGALSIPSGDVNTVLTNDHSTFSTSATSTATSASASSTSSAASSSSSSSGLSTTTIIAIAVPIGAIVILAPILYIIWIKYRTRNMKKLDSEPRYSPSPSKEPKFRPQSPNPPPKEAFLPPMFSERGQTKEGSLFDEVRMSMDSARRNEPPSRFDRPREDFGAKDNSYNVYNLRKSLEDKGRTDSIGLFDLSRNNTDRSSPSMHQQRGPSPTLPSPNVPLFDRPPSEAWPLPASKLPAPQSLYDPYINTNKPLPTASMATSAPPSGPLPAPPGSRHENQPSAFVSNLPPHQNIQDYRPSSSGRQGVNPTSGHPRSASGHDSASSSRYNSPEPVQSAFSPLNHGEHRGRHRDSDLVSELSYRSPSTDRDPKRRSTDAISVVSAISHRRRRSERDADALSMISALSPEQDETPRIPIEHYPRS